MNVSGLGKWQVKQEMGGQRSVINGIYFPATSTGELHSLKTLSSSRNYSLLCFCTLSPSKHMFPPRPCSCYPRHVWSSWVRPPESCTVLHNHPIIKIPSSIPLKLAIYFILCSWLTQIFSWWILGITFDFFFIVHCFMLFDSWIMWIYWIF